MSQRTLVGVTVAAAAITLSVAGCGSSSGHSGGATSLTLYTCASDNVEQAVISHFERTHSGAKVNVFRAPTAQLNARIAADVRSGGIRADVIWACDPLTMHGYDGQGLLAKWSPPNGSDIPPAQREDDFAAVDILYMVVVVHNGTSAPASWADLTKPQYKGQVALPSPTFAASALGLLGYLKSAPGYGMHFYRDLKANGAAQMDTPADVLTAVEQGSYRVGVTLANAAYADRDKGSPITVVWPRPGGVSIYSPIGITTKHDRSALADAFAAFVAGREGQKILAEQDTYPIRHGLGGPPIPAGSRVVEPDWPALFASYRTTLGDYTDIFGG